LEKHLTFLDRYKAATQLSRRVHALTPAKLGHRQSLKLAREYANAAAELDALDDVIADTNALLNRGSTWRAAWEHQVAPFRKDLEGLDELLSEHHGQGDSATAAALRSFRDRSRQDLEQWSAELADGALQPERALDRLREARTQLSSLLEDHAATVIAGFAKNEREAEVMRNKMETARKGTKNHRRPPQPNILGTIYPSYYFVSVPMFTSGLDSGVSSVTASRGGGATTGYGSTGGSFSGSGSSSSF
jgi:chromosome segregation ATPase